jgi:hypothetical protein
MKMLGFCGFEGIVFQWKLIRPIKNGKNKNEKEPSDY